MKKLKSVLMKRREFIPLEKKENNIYEGNVKIPAGGKCSINVKLPGNSQYWGIAEY